MGRPLQSFHDFVGQSKTVRYLRRLCAGALGRGEPFPHVMVCGESGLGKTQLVRALAQEYGTSMKCAMGYDSNEDIIRQLSGIQKCEFLFVDEAHELTPFMQAVFYRAIDELKVRVNEDQGADDASDDRSSGYRDLPPHTIILATDHPGPLKKAMRDRMAKPVFLARYSLAELKAIVAKMAADVRILLSPQASRMVAEISHGVPRHARQHLRHIRLIFPRSESEQLGLPEIQEYMKDAGIDAAGLGQLDRRYLRFLAEFGSASLESMALRLGSDRLYIQRQIEPTLLRLGLIGIAPGGRQLTDKGLEYVKHNILRDR